MPKLLRVALLTALGLVSGGSFASAEDKKEEAAGAWTTIKGKIVFDGAKLPLQEEIKPTQDQKVCNMDKDLKTEDWVVDPKTKGVRDVYVWLAPDIAKRGVPFPKDKIHPTLMKPKVDKVSITQPCCRFMAHATGAREGQTMIIEGSPDIAHNAKWDSSKNGAYNPIIPAGGSFTIPNPLVAEPGVISLNCSIHAWMKATVRVFDHPYYAVTDEKGDFVIANAPVGKFRLYVWKDANGYLNGKEGAFGQTMDLKAGNMDLGEIKMKKND